MRMAEQLGNVLVLEDDMVVSPFFQAYLNKSTVNVSADVSGIALYRYSIVEQNHFPFYLIPNDEFVYYQQRACSNGTFYTWEMLKPYFEFLDSFAHNYSDYHLPENVRKWGDEVWEKSFYCYLIKNKKYLAFPRFSPSTDFADYGVHMKKQTLKYVHQTKLYLGSTFGKISRLEDTHNVFDSFYELSPKTIKRFNKELSDYDFESDVYGFKDLQYVKTPYLLSSKNTLNAKCGWERRLKPEINNVLLNQIGDFYSLGKTGGFIQKNHIKSLKEDFLYYYPDTKLTDLVRMKIQKEASFHYYLV